MRVEWLDGKLTMPTPTTRPEADVAPTDGPDVFTISLFRESGELARFERRAGGRVTSLFLAVARLHRLEPVSTD
jgi:hypothetical protein